MSKTILSILMIMIGLILGVGLSVLINFIRVSKAVKKIEILSERGVLTGRTSELFLTTWLSVNPHI